MKGVFENMAISFDELSKKTKDVAAVAADRAKDAVEIVKVNVAIAGEQREMFDLVAKDPGTHQGILNELKRRYLTEDELQAERDAAAAARQQAEQRQKEELALEIRDKYSELSDGTLQSAVKFLDEYKYYRDKRPIACRVLREHLDGLLEARDYVLDSREAARFLYICNKLVREKALGFTEAQNYITNVKERAEHDADD